MAITTVTELDAARAEARSLVHRRALKAAARAASPIGFGSDAVADLIEDVQAAFGLTREQKAALAPAMLTSFTGLAAAYAPAALGVEAVAGLTAQLAANPVGRIAGRMVGGRFVRRIASGRGLLGRVARRAWLVPAALGGGAAVGYELLGRRCINQCYAYLRPRLGTTALLPTPR